MLRRVCLLVGWFAVVAHATGSLAAEVSYDLTLKKKTLQIGGAPADAMTINDGLPGPTLRFTEGDHAIIRVHNQMPVGASIHWHGILLPNSQDGVPFLTTPPIMPGTMREFRFPIIQSGTYWYHSHTKLQEEQGVYGSIVITPRDTPPQADRDYVLVLSEWSNDPPSTIMRTLKRGSDWYAIKKRQRQSLLGAIRHGGLRSLWERSIRSMPQADVSDVAYDRFLANGQPVATLDAAPGETVRVRVIGASAATYYYLSYAGGPMRIVAADGQDVVPLEKDRFLMAIAETYDLLLRVPGDRAYELRATAQDGSGHSSLFIGRGRRVLAPDVPPPDIYSLIDFEMMPSPYLPWRKPAMDMDAGKPMDMQGMDMSGMKANSMPMPAMSGGMQMERPQSGRPPTPYAELRAPHPTALPAGRPVREYELVLEGDMERYVWTINGETLSESDDLLVRRGENVRFILVNKTMMHHPMHLHGHFFRVVNGQGDYAPLKHTVDVDPGGRTVIEFAADEEKDWFFHCHVLYHLKSGMARVVHYEGSEVSADLIGIRPNLYRDSVYAFAHVVLLSQMTDGVAVVRNTRNDGVVEWEYDWEDRYDISLTYQRYVNRLFSLQAGGNFTDESQRGIFGFRGLLPLEFDTAFWVGTDGNVRTEVGRELVLTSRFSLFGSYEFNSKETDEWVGGGEFVVTRWLSLVGQWHSEYGAGGGVTLRF